MIGIPIQSKSLNTLDPPLSTVQIPTGVPVAIDGAANAAILAAEILGIKYPEVANRLMFYLKELKRRAPEVRV